MINKLNFIFLFLMIMSTCNALSIAIDIQVLNERHFQKRKTNIHSSLSCVSLSP
ncbi:hypothetical protein BCR42DRAFT_421243 [Absidia repens]|uniref:Lipoprotein n=1 Tax=Absidia repens TaxID=90262 RepID=A0A1X2I893_9FUNG|nr:hypothetical protein BCR42DRAFT_421243 [Absidia repens]